MRRRIVGAYAGLSPPRHAVPARAETARIYHLPITGRKLFQVKAPVAHPPAVLACAGIAVDARRAGGSTDIHISHPAALSMAALHVGHM